MRLSPHHYVDRFVNLCKWPAAASSLLIALPACETLIDTAKLYWRHHTHGLVLLAGMVLFALPWLWRRRLPDMGFWETFEHEMTHILFALLTLHSVRGIQATHDNGGVMTYEGYGNWLVTISPYFFPTVPLLAGLLALALPGSLQYIGIGGMGFALAWHATATLGETHGEQSDLKRVGKWFALAFLPGATLASLGFVLALAIRGENGAAWYAARFSRHFAKMIF